MPLGIWGGIGGNLWILAIEAWPHRSKSSFLISLSLGALCCTPGSGPEFDLGNLLRHLRQGRRGQRCSCAWSLFIESNHKDINITSLRRQLQSPSHNYNTLARLRRAEIFFWLLAKDHEECHARPAATQNCRRGGRTSDTPYNRLQNLTTWM